VTRVQVRRMVHGGRGYNVGRSKVNCNLTVYVLEGYQFLDYVLEERKKTLLLGELLQVPFQIRKLGSGY